MLFPGLAPSPDLAHTFHSQSPLNFTAAINFPLSNETFIWCTGTTERLIGLFMAFGILPRLIIVAALGVINLTLTIFG